MENKNKVLYTCYKVDPVQMVAQFGAALKNVYADHCTIEYMPKSVKGFKEGQMCSLCVTGRLQTERVDCLVLGSPNQSKKKHPHITMSLADGVRPAEVDREIEDNLDRIEPWYEFITGRKKIVYA